MSSGWRRRRILTTAGAVAAGTLLRPAFAAAAEAGGWDDGFDAGPVKHILPSVDHERILLKTSFRTSVAAPPVLLLNGRPIGGTRADNHGRFWSFEATGLEADTEYTLQLVTDRKQPLTAPWPLRTFPAPDTPRESVRILVYTCAGGFPDVSMPGGRRPFLPLVLRQRLLARGLSFQPQAVIANGDHVYWDQRGIFLRSSERMQSFIRSVYEPYGELDRRLPVHGTANEDVLVGVVDRQIADLYGTRLRSTPVWFLSDDHDYFENDDATAELVTFPPDPFMLRLARATQHLYYPEFLLGPGQPAGLPGAGAGDRRKGLSECYGVLRYGKLLEALLYDTRRYATLKGSTGVFVDPIAEAWITGRTVAERDAEQLIHVPSHPFGWSAGKWMEWYPDRLNAEGELAVDAKPYWQSGWFTQHQRLVRALSEQRQRPAFVVSGDLHMVGAGRIRRSGDLEATANPVTTLVAGSLGTGDTGWPSVARGTLPKAAHAIQMEELAAATEQNGFTVLDITRERIDVRMFAWRPPEPAAAIDRLQPYAQFSVGRIG